MRALFWIILAVYHYHEARADTRAGRNGKDVILDLFLGTLYLGLAVFSFIKGD